MWCASIMHTYLLTLLMGVHYAYLLAYTYGSPLCTCTYLLTSPKELYIDICIQIHICIARCKQCECSEPAKIIPSGASSRKTASIMHTYLLTYLTEGRPLCIFTFLLPLLMGVHYAYLLTYLRYFTYFTYG